MSGRVSDDEPTPRRPEITKSNVDGDALLAFSLKTIEQQRKIQLIARGAKNPAGAVQLDEMIVEDDLRIVKEPADQRRFSVVNASAGQEPQGVLPDKIARRSRAALKGRVQK
jgi:hypothetical protein